MALLTQVQVAKLAEIIRKHASWVSWRLLGDKFVTKKDLASLEADGLLPKSTDPSVIRQSFVLGKLESLLKESEWRGLTWDQIKAAATAKQTPLQQAQVEAAEMSLNITLRGVFNDIQQGLFEDLAQATGTAITEAVIKDKVAEEIKSGVEESKNYIQVANGLVERLREPTRNWHRVASNELHAAREKGVVNSILSGEDVYRRADGVKSYVAVVPDSDACDDCKRLYLDKRGTPKVFLLEELMENEGTNYIRPWRKNARPVVPPLHPGCFCRVRYVPPGWGWNDKGRFTVVDSDKYVQHLEEKVAKSVEILRKAEDHSLLNDSLQHIPSPEEIEAIQDPEEAVQLTDRLGRLLELHTDDPEAYRQIEDLYHKAAAHAVTIRGMVNTNEG